MNINVSGCYYHPDRAAVAVCPQCGRGICRECAVKDVSGRVLCYKCGNSNLRQEYKTYKERLKQRGGRFRKGSEFIVPGIIGMGIVALSLISQYGNLQYTFSSVGSAIAYIFTCYILFSIPFSMVMLSDLFSPQYLTGSVRSIIWVFKLTISMCIGWIVFTFYWVRFIVTKIKSSKERRKEKN